MLHRARHRSPSLALVGAAALAAVVGCTGATEGVDFGGISGDAVEEPYDSGPGTSGGDGGGTTADPPITDGGATDGGSTGTTGGPGADAGTPATGTLSFSVLTAAVGGRFAPRNIGAIWVETSAGVWVKTLAVWAGTRERYLTRFATSAKRNRVDAVTSATLKTHTTHTVTWNSTDLNRQVVADGEYRIVMETTDRDGTGASFEVPFTKSALPVNTTPVDQKNFLNMSLSYQ